MIRFFLWVFLFIVVIDVAVSYEFEAPKNDVRPDKLTQYFDYGRPIESKIFRLMGEDNEQAANLAKAGWFKPFNASNDTDRHKQRVVVYGMSFSNHIGEIISKQDESLDVKMFAGPGAPLNHSYAYFQRHRQKIKKGDIVVLGILASSTPRMNTLSHMTKNFESPAPHLYPRYSIDDNNQLVESHIPIDSLAELREASHDKKRWNDIKQQLAEGDSFYDELLFEEDLTAKSSYLNLIRRAWGQRYTREVVKKYHDNSGFKNTDNMIDISQKLVSNFAAQVRSQGAVPYIILFNDRGYKDHLYNIIEPTLTAQNIPFYSSHIDFPADNLSNFISDGHFTPEIDHAIAESVLKDIKGLAS